MLETYHGGRPLRSSSVPHPGADLGTIGECNCSICTKKGILHLGWRTMRSSRDDDKNRLGIPDRYWAMIECGPRPGLLARNSAKRLIGTPDCYSLRRCDQVFGKRVESPDSLPRKIDFAGGPL